MAMSMGTGTCPPDPQGRRGPPGPPGPFNSTPLNSGTSAWAGARSNGDRSYAQIISDSKSLTANIVLKIKLEPCSGDKKSMNISDSQLGDFIFNDLKLPVDDVLQLGFSTGRNNSKEILVKYTTDVRNITTNNINPPHHLYKDYKITISTLDDKSTKITFINVPLNVPIEEIRHLCKVYGKLTDGTVHTVPVKLEGQNKATLPGATRTGQVRSGQWYQTGKRCPMGTLYT